VAEPTRTASAADIHLDSVDFQFLDPPEPGAHARLTVQLSNSARLDSGPVLVSIPSDWFASYAMIGTIPSVLDDSTTDMGERTFRLASFGGNSVMTFELHVTATDEVTDPPHVAVRVSPSELIGESTPRTEAPLPRPGPAMRIDVPRLQLHAGVMQVSWEPPPRVVGQIRGTANVSTGNTVLVGHLTGASGNVFGHLDRLEPGDRIAVESRGLPYEFTVSRKFTGSNTDSSPIQPTDTPRLTLMTCAGIWNPFTRDYSERLWVIAEPPDLAAQTIAAAAATATAEAATATAEATPEPTETPTLEPPTPTPYAGEPSPSGGLGNTRADLGRALGAPLGESAGGLAVFRSRGIEYHVAFSPEPERAELLVELPARTLSFAAAVQESRRLLPLDTQPRLSAPEGNDRFVIERFTSPSLAEALGDGDFLVMYIRDRQGNITRLAVSLSDEVDELYKTVTSR
jgi:hypothetical protein